MIELPGAAAPTKTSDSPAAGKSARAPETKAGAERTEDARGGERTSDDPFALLVAQDGAEAVAALSPLVAPAAPAAPAATGEQAASTRVAVATPPVLGDAVQAGAAAAAVEAAAAAATVEVAQDARMPATPSAAAASVAEAEGVMPPGPMGGFAAKSIEATASTAPDAVQEPAPDSGRIDADPARTTNEEARRGVPPASPEPVVPIRAAAEPTVEPPSPPQQRPEADEIRAETVAGRPAAAPEATMAVADGAAATSRLTDAAKPGRTVAPDVAFARVDAAAPDAMPSMADGPDARLDASLTRLDSMPRAPAAQTPPAVATMEAALRRLDGGEIEIRLDPPELGRVKVSLAPSEAGLIATVIAERPEAADLMRRHAEALVRSLAEAGHEDVTLQFGSEGRQQTAGNGDEAEAAGMEAVPITATAPQTARTRTVSAGLDLRV